MRLRRLQSMGITELAYRGRQETSKWLERMGMSGRTNGALNGTGNMLHDYFRYAGSSRFFEGAVSEQTPALFAAHLPGTRDQAIAVAEAICQGRFDLLGYRSLSFGDPVDWHLDPVSGRRAPFAHWSRLDPLDPAEVGDSKVVWELNRHQWMVSLGQAYWLTEDERYAETFAARIREWRRANPPGMGINWASSLEVALRLISWCWALLLFKRSKALSPELFLCLWEWIGAHARHVEKYLSYYFAPNTHLTGEALGLFYAGVAFPELRRAGHWRELGARILVDQLQRQVFPDGVYFEQSTCYQRYTVEIYLHFLILAACNDIAVPTTVQEHVQRLLDFLLVIRLPDGSIPQIGDADGGWLLPLTTRAAEDGRGVFAAAAAFFNRPDYAWAAGGVQPEVLWLLGTSGLSAFQALRAVPPASNPSRLFPEGGYCVMKSRWEPDAHDLIFDVGPLGSMNAGHGHADLLSIQCAVFGEPYLADPGTYCYTADPAWRDFFRSTNAHSSVVVDGVSQAVPDGPFHWEVRPRARLRRWLSTEGYDFADAEHDAYRHLPDPVVHRRRVLFVKPRYWVVVDDLDGAADHGVDVRFQFAPLALCMDPPGWVRARGRRGHGLLIRAFATVPLTTTLHEGRLAPIQGWYSPDYGRRQPAPVLIYSTVTRLPLRIVTLLLPTEKPLDPPPPVSPLVGEGAALLGLVFGQGGELVVIREDDVAVQCR